MLTRHPGIEAEKTLIHASLVFWKGSDHTSKCGVTAMRPHEVIWAVNVDKTTGVRTEPGPRLQDGGEISDSKLCVLNLLLKYILQLRHSETPL